MKKFLICFLSIIILLGAIGDTVIAARGITFESLPFAQSFNTDELTQRQAVAHEMAECARKLGLPETCETIKTAQKIWADAQAEKDAAKAQYAAWQTKFNQYPYATYIWIYLTQQLGYNNAVAAGIIGNCMAEVGGQTLNIQYWIGGSGYYGMCQWSRRYFPGVIGADLPGQCQFLANTMSRQFGSSLSSFLSLQDPGSAALIFARKYERCTSASYGVRQRNAAKAYVFFTN